ncbi:unnamed protein product [Nesidiocoris tenuis]|uniref:Uncharacterized protein n=1 Tax=Nesidiocoris tenuis TaxID=355587 RepID=A0A6H5HKC4_9HEMI|nr:unnamed protein product [Nesidiocoris tenuis]
MGATHPPNAKGLPGTMWNCLLTTLDRIWGADSNLTIPLEIDERNITRRG